MESSCQKKSVTSLSILKKNTSQIIDNRLECDAGKRRPVKVKLPPTDQAKTSKKSSTYSSVFIARNKTKNKREKGRRVVTALSSCIMWSLMRYLYMGCVIWVFQFFFSEFSVTWEWFRGWFIFIVQSVMHIHLQIVTEICHLAQMLLLDPRMELARETFFKLSGTCQKWPRPFWGSRAYSNFWISVQEGRRDFIFTPKCPQWPHLF